MLILSLHIFWPQDCPRVFFRKDLGNTVDLEKLVKDQVVFPLASLLDKVGPPKFMLQLWSSPTNINGVSYIRKAGT
jgi:hypothetical protein